MNSESPERYRWVDFGSQLIESITVRIMRHDDFDEICAAKGETIQTRPRLPPELWSKIFDIAWGMHIPCKKCWDRAATLFDDHQDSWPSEYRFTALAWAIKRKCLPIAEWLDEKGPSAKRKGSKLLQWMIDQSFEDPIEEYCDYETEYLQMWVKILGPRECMDLDLLTEIYCPFVWLTDDGLNDSIL